MTRALVTGGTGFAGQFLVRHLADDGVEVHVTAHASHDAAPGAAGIHRVDVSDHDDVRSLVEHIRPDEVYHLAGITRPASGDVEKFYDVNLGGARNVLDAVASAAPEARLLLVGSAYAYARCDEPITEDIPLAPRNHYGASKAAAEMIGRAYAAAGLGVVLARPFNHSGPGQSPDFILPTIVEQVAHARAEGAERVTLELGNLDSVRDIADVRDIVAGYVVAIRSGEPGVAYNLGSGTGRTIRELVDAVARAAGIDHVIEQRGDRVRADDIPVLVSDSTRLRNLGWRAEREFDTMVSDMLAAATEHSA